MSKLGVVRRSLGALMKVISWLRLLTVNLLFVAVVVLIIFALRGGAVPTIPHRGALIINPAGTLVDQLAYIDPVGQLLGDTDPETQETLLQDVVDAIDLAADDERITSAVLSLDYLAHGGISKMQEITAALQRFRDAGKKVYAYGDNYSQDQYLLASSADEVYLHPMGSVMLQGYGVYRNYFRDALDKLEVNVHVFRVGQYKSAMEPFMRDDMSSEDREANLSWLNSLWGDYREQVLTQRKISGKAFDSYIANADQFARKYAGDLATAALAAGLVDGIKTRDEVNALLIEAVGAEDDDGYYEGVAYDQYLWLQNLEHVDGGDADGVGLIVASGMILDGYQPPGSIGGDSLAELVRDARLDESVRAVVLRIDSGGGSAFASEIIRRELTLLRDAGKPLVVSMGSVAASGGYWIAAGADEIWATPTTLTGSIGIFGAFPTLEDTLAKMGIYTDGVGTTPLAGSFRIDRPLDSVTADVIQSSLENGYQRFLTIVREGRGMESDAVSKVAEGRVWSGRAALEIGLVDQLGNLDGAIRAAAELAQLDEDYEIYYIEQPLSPQEELLHHLLNVVAPVGGKSFMNGWQSLLAPLSQLLASVRAMNDPQGMYAHCTVCLAP